MPDAAADWYKDAVIYELHVRAFQDSDGNGIGDFKGLTRRLDYLQDLGVTTLWLLPFYPSPLRDDGYDIADYLNVHPSYGTLDDFKEFLDAAHARGLRVITELVLNHTSDQHPWFQRARAAPVGSPERDFYVWSDTAEKYPGVRVIFNDYEPSNWTWDPVARQYYWHRFYSHQPDLNYDNPAVHEAIMPAVDFWFGLGVDGVRLDAVPYLYERDGTACENLPETHAFLRKLRKHVDDRYPNRMLLAEANQWPEDAVAYFGAAGDECHMCFHFPLMPRLFMAVHSEQRFPIIDILNQTPPLPDGCQWGLFLRNHDELTLEMVTDEERDALYKAYAAEPQARFNLGIRRRLAPLLGNDRRRIELLTALMMSLPGTPVLYYGDEIGMGDNYYLGDRNGVRTPMQWSADRNAGFSAANPQRLYLPTVIDPEYHYETVNVENQQNTSSSLLWWTKRLIAVRKQFRAFGRGELQFVPASNAKVLAFVRKFEGERILVVANLSRFAQYADIDLAEYKGCVPRELLGRAAFPAVGDRPYPMAVGPHSCLWFNLEQATEAAAVPTGGLPLVSVRAGWDELFRRVGWPKLAKVVSLNIARQEGHAPEAVAVRDAIAVKAGDADVYLTLLDVTWADVSEVRLLPIGLATGDGPGRRLAEIIGPDGNAVGRLYDGHTDPAFCAAVLRAVATNRRYPFAGGQLRCVAGSELTADGIQVEAFRPEPHSTCVVFGGKLILKIYDALDTATHPDLELGRFLAKGDRFKAFPAVRGWVEYAPPTGEPATLAVVHDYLPDQGFAWQRALDDLSRYLETVLATSAVPEPLPGLEAGDAAEPPADLGATLHLADQLGRHTAELHAALAAGTDAAFAPEPFTRHYQRGVYQALRQVAGTTFHELRTHLSGLDGDARVLAERVRQREAACHARLRYFSDHALNCDRTRTHGDLHLGRWLNTGSDYALVDFQGDPRRPMSERRIKRTPLRDVASMLWSFRFAAACAVFGVGTSQGSAPGVVRPEDRPRAELAARTWRTWATARFLAAYRAAWPDDGVLPPYAVWPGVLDVFLIERGLEQVGNDLREHPALLPPALYGLAELLDEARPVA